MKNVDDELEKQYEKADRERFEAAKKGKGQDREHGVACGKMIQIRDIQDLLESKCTLSLEKEEIEKVLEWYGAFDAHSTDGCSSISNYLENQLKEHDALYNKIYNQLEE